MTSKFFWAKMQLVLSFALSVALLIFIASASAAPWSFGIISDIQRKSSPDGKNPNDVAVNIINHINFDEQ